MILVGDGAVKIGCFMLKMQFSQRLKVASVHAHGLEPRLLYAERVLGAVPPSCDGGGVRQVYAALTASAGSQGESTRSAPTVELREQSGFGGLETFGCLPFAGGELFSRRVVRLSSACLSRLA